MGYDTADFSLMNDHRVGSSIEGRTYVSRMLAHAIPYVKRKS